MILDATTKSLRIVLGEAKTADDCDVTANWADETPNTFSPINNATHSNGTTPVVIVPAPAAGIVRNVQEIRLHNNDTVPHTVTLQLLVSATVYIVDGPETIQPDANYIYDPTSTSGSGSPASLLLESGDASLKISQLPSGGGLDGTELLAVVQSGATVQETLNALALFLFTSNYATSPFQNPSGSPGVQMLIQGADGVGTGSGSELDIFAGGSSGDPASAGGPLIIQAGAGNTGGTAGGASLAGGPGPSDGSSPGGDGAVSGGAGINSGKGGNGIVVGGSGGSGGLTPGDGGDAKLLPGPAGNLSAVMGKVVIDLTPFIVSTPGLFEIIDLATTDPAAANAIWNDNGALVFSGNPTHTSASVASGSAVGLTSGTAADVTSITVAHAGVYKVSGSVYFTGAAGTTVTRVAASLGSSSATLDTTPGQFANQYLAGAVMSAIGQDIAVVGFSTILTLAAAATVHLCALATFATSTLSAYGRIDAVPVT